MKKSFFIAIAMVLSTMLAVFTSCEEERVGTRAQSTSDTIRIVKGFSMETSLSHKWDSTYRISISDDIESTLKIWRTEEGSKIEPAAYDGKLNLLMKASSMLSKTDYAISEDQVKITPTSSTIIRGQKLEENGSYTEIDTLRFWFSDGQILSVPVEIHNGQVEISGHTFDAASLTLVTGEFASLKNSSKSAKTRALYKSADYQTEYKVWLTLKEKNVINPQQFVVPVYASTGRYVMSEDELTETLIKNKKRELIDSISERCSFDIVKLYKSGDSTKVHKEIVLNHKFEGIDAYNKYVDNFDYKLKENSGSIANGTEAARESGQDGWSVWKKTDKYSAGIENGVDNDKVVTDYTLMHERAEYVEDTLKVEFGYEDINVQEIQTSVSALTSDKSGYKKAELNNKISASYMGESQSLNESVYLYMESTDITGYEIINPDIKVTKDSVIVSLDFVTKYENGSKTTVNDRLAAPRSLEPKSDWTSIQEVLSQMTDSTVTVILADSTAKEDGYWKYQTEIRNISNNVVLYDGTVMENKWQSVVPNRFTYEREGKSYSFDVLSYSAKNKGAALNYDSEDDDYTVYSYTDVMEETFGTYVLSSTAPGTVKIAKSETPPTPSKTITGYEFRNPSLTVTDTDVTAALTYVTKYSDGTEDEEDVSKSFARSHTPYTDWTSTEENNSALTGDANVNLTGTEAKTDGGWSYTLETRNTTTTAQLQGSNQTNGLKTVDPNSIKFTKNGETYEFTVLTFSAESKDTKVTLDSETDSVSTYKYVNELSFTYGDNTQSANLPGTINVNKVVEPTPKTITGYEIRNAKLTTAKDGVTAELDFITKWSDGSEDKESMSKLFARNFKVISNWSSDEENAEQTTGSASVNLKSSKNNTDGDWGWVVETRNITTTATLNGSSQTNKWESKDPNSITFSKNGVSHSFDALSFTATEKGSKVSKSSEDDEKTVYSYTDKISVSYGTNSFNSTAPGTINVTKAWEPDFNHGKFVAAHVTTARDETRTTWLYVVSVHFETGTLPILIRKDADKPEVNEAYFDTDTDSRLNSGSWIKSWNKWINTIASDNASLMEWYTPAGANADSMSYPAATVWGWDNGYTVGGHPSVTTDKFSAEISKDGYTLKIYKGSYLFATYRANK